MEHCDMREPSVNSGWFGAEASQAEKANPYPQQVCILRRTQHWPFYDINILCNHPATRLVCWGMLPYSGLRVSHSYGHRAPSSHFSQINLSEWKSMSPNP